MVKDRLADFRKMEGRPASLEECDGARAEDPLLSQTSFNSMEQFLLKVSEIGRKLDESEAMLERMRKIHAELLTHPDTDPKLTNELSALDDNFRTALRFVLQKVQGWFLFVLSSEHILIFEMRKEGEQTQDGTANGRMKFQHTRVIATRCSELQRRYNSEQEQYKEKRKKNVSTYLKIQGLEVADDVIMDAIDNGNIDDLSKGIVLAAAQKKALFDEVRSRRDELFSIEKSMRELHEIFHDLNLLVDSQGDMVDHIEANIQAAAEYADKAKDDVIGARNLQKKARKMKIIICIVLVILVIILFFVLQGIVCHFTPIC